MMTRFSRLFAASSLVVAGLALQSPARAGFVTATATIGGSALAGAASYSTLDGRTMPGANSTQTTANGLTVVTTGNAQYVNTSVAGQYASPTFSGGNNTFFYPNGNAPANGADTTTYLSSGSGTASSITFSNGRTGGGNLGTYFGLLWGSVDSFNSLTFNFADGSASQTIAGNSPLLGMIADMGNTYYVNFTASTAISSVVATSGSNSFEIDNVAFGTVPEPSSMALCGIAGLIGLGVARKRAKRVIA